MSRKKRIEAFALIAQGFTLLSEAEKEMLETPTATYTVPKPYEPTQEKSVEEPTKTSPEKNAVKDDLDEMNLLELKTLAKDMKIDYPKNVRKEDLIEIIRNENTNNKQTVDEADISTKTDGKNTNIKKQTNGKDNNVVLPEDETMKQLLEETKDMEDDEIRNILSDAGISEKGGRNALLAKLYQAVNDGVISLEEDGDEDEVVSVDSNERKKIDIEDTIDTSKFTSDKDTKERQQAILKFVQETYDDFEEGKITLQKLRDHLKENFEVTLPKKATPADILDKYIECAIKFIDDNGETVKEGAYYIQDVPYCCGEPLEITTDENNNDIATCHICGCIYDFED